MSDLKNRKKIRDVVTSEDGTQSVDFNAPEYKRSRLSYNVECAVEYFITFAFTDSILAVLLAECGFDTAAIGILSTMSTVAGFFQIITAIIIQRITHKRLFAVLLHTLSELLYIGAYILPFVNASQKVLTIAMIVAIVGGAGLRNVATSVIFSWANSFVNPKKRGIFQSTKELASLISGLIVSLLMGVAIDSFKEAGNIKGSFAFILVLLIIFTVIDFISLMLIENKFGGIHVEVEKGTFKDALRNTLGNRSFLLVLIMAFIHAFGYNIAFGFVGNYKVTTLGMSLTLVQGITIAAQVARAILSRPFGKYSDRKTFVGGYELGILLQLIGFVIFVFTASDTWWLIIPFTLINGIASGVTDGNLSNMTYSYVDSKYIVEGMAVLFTFSGVGGILGSLIGGKILSTIQGADGLGLFNLGFTAISAEQFLSIIAIVIMTGVWLFCHFVVRRIQVKIQ